MSIREIENSIILYLKDKFPEFLVDGFPEKPQEFILLHPVGAVLVHYRGGNYTNLNSLGIISQTRGLSFAITVVTRNLRNNNGAYETLDKVKQYLCGYKINGCTKMIPQKEGFISETNGIWQYEIEFNLTTPSIEEMEEI